MALDIQAANSVIDEIEGLVSETDVPIAGEPNLPALQQYIRELRDEVFAACTKLRGLLTS